MTAKELVKHHYDVLVEKTASIKDLPFDFCAYEISNYASWARTALLELYTRIEKNDNASVAICTAKELIEEYRSIRDFGWEYMESIMWRMIRKMERIDLEEKGLGYE